MPVFNSILDMIGNTPMVRLNRIVPEGGGTVYAKLEQFNPSGSVKARAAYSMITAAEEAGKLKPGMVLAEATSGNLGLAVSMVGAVKGWTSRKRRRHRDDRARDISPDYLPAE